LARITNLSKVIIDLKDRVVRRTIVIFLFRKAHVGICSPLRRVDFRVSFGDVDEDHLGCPRLTHTRRTPKIDEEGFSAGSTKISQMRKSRSKRAKSGNTGCDEIHKRVRSTKLPHLLLEFETMFIGDKETIHMLSIVVVFRRADGKKSVNALHPRLSEFSEWRDKGRFK